MDYWGSFPDELIIHVLLSLIDNPRPILRFAQTSKRHNAIATDDDVWLPITVYIFKWFGVPGVHVDQNILRQHRNRILTQVRSHQNVYHQLYVRLIGPYTWLLGWWIMHDQAPLGLWRAYIRFTPHSAGENICSIVGHPVIAGYNLYKTPEDLHPAVQYAYSIDRPDGFYAVGLEDQPPVAGYGHNPASVAYPLNRTYQIDWYFRVRPSDEFTELPIPKRDHYARRLGRTTSCAFTPPFDTSPWTNVALNTLSGRLLDSRTKYDDAPFPSPSSIPVVPDVKYDVPTGLPVVPRATWSWRDQNEWTSTQHFATRIHSPSYYPPETDEILANGIYRTPGIVKAKFIFLRTRDLTPEDFVESWPWEGHFGSSSRGEEQLEAPEKSLDWSDPDVHLGPFSAVRCTIMEAKSSRLTSEDHVRPGARVLDMVKLSGGGAPSGQRTMIAFLQDPKVSPNRLAELKAKLPMSYQDLAKSDSPPWPISRAAMADPTVPATSTSILQTPFAPERGIDLPALGRSAQPGFTLPSWLDVIVHVESRDQFTVFWRDLNMFEVYTKMNDI